MSLKQYRLEIIIYLILSLLCIFFSLKDLNWGFEMVEGIRHSRINNYIIFSNAYTDMINGKELYVGNADLYYDLYKYTLTFALFMAPFAMLPLGMGLISWNLLNLFVFFIGVRSLPSLKYKNVLFIVLFSTLELMGSIQNDQSNGLMTGLILLFVGLMERQKPFLALAILAFSVYIKLFSIVFFLFLLFYPSFYKNLIISSFWMIFFFLLPMIFTGKEYFLEQYQAWINLLSKDHAISYGYSVMGIFNSWFGIDIDKILFVVGSFILSCLPLLKLRNYQDQNFRYSMLALFLIWVVIFNHKSESPLFILAMSGISLWYVKSEANFLNTSLMVFAILFISIAFSELMPRDIMENYFYKYSLKALPATFIWGKIIFDLLKSSTSNDIESMAQGSSGHQF